MITMKELMALLFDWHTPEGAAKELGMSIATFWRRVQKGRIATFKFRGFTYVTKEEIDRYKSAQN